MAFIAGFTESEPPGQPWHSGAPGQAPAWPGPAPLNAVIPAGRRPRGTGRAALPGYAFGVADASWLAALVPMALTAFTVK
jgi:hypothetical protein